jgi:phage tail-like protein
MRSTGVPLGLNWQAPSAAAFTGVPPVPPYLTFNFAVELEGLLVGGFTEVSGLESAVELEEYREGGVNGFVHQLPGVTTHTHLVLKQGLTAVSALWDWYHDTTRGVIQRRNGTILLLDRRQVPVMWWNVRRALPIRWTGPSFDATSDHVGVESLELAHEGLTKPLLGERAVVARDRGQAAGG